MFRQTHFLLVSIAFVIGVILTTSAFVFAFGAGVGLRAVVSERAAWLFAAMALALLVAFVIGRLRDQISVVIVAIGAASGALLYATPTIYFLMHALPSSEQSSGDIATLSGKLLGAFIACALPFLGGCAVSWPAIRMVSKPAEKVDPDVF